ncbi:MAG: GbsR/MarR family transcriptional regulator [Bacillota bacterium]
MDEKLSGARDTLIQALGRQSAFWGMGRTVGEIYAVLLLSTGPLSLEEVAKRMGVTKGNVSVSVRQLEQLGMVRRSWQKGDRRVFFEAETDFWKIVHIFLGLRHKPEFEQSFTLLEESTLLAAQGEPSAERESVMDRLRSLQEFYRLLDGMVEAALAMGPERLKAAAGMFIVAAGAGIAGQNVDDK